MSSISHTVITPHVTDTFSYTDCHLCPRQCHVNRNHQSGFCQSGSQAKIARAALHFWEEPCISGINGSGTVFFSGCTLRCCFCQNSKISQHDFGITVTPRQLADIFLNLQHQGAHNINLVTATQYLPDIIRAFDLIKDQLTIPVVYNCGGYESPEVIEALKDYVDIWLPDLKYQSSELSFRYSASPDYFEKASRAIQTMISVTGTPVFVPFADTDSISDYKLNSSSDSTSDYRLNSSSDLISSAKTSSVIHGIPEKPELYLMKRGVILRHLVLPKAKEDSIHLLHWIKETLPKGQYLISLMSQYTPYHTDELHPELNRRITSYEYQQVLKTAEQLGLEDGFIQKKSSAKEEYTPPFDLEGCL